MLLRCEQNLHSLFPRLNKLYILYGCTEVKLTDMTRLNRKAKSHLSSSVEIGKIMLCLLNCISQLYGVSESFEARSGSLGGLVAGCSAYIRDVNSGAKLGPHQTGELMVRSLTRMNGYLGRELDTREFFTEQGFAHTGDLVHYDHKGNLYFKDRVKEMMKVKASWVGPAEIESCIEQKPEVLESCVWVGSGLFRRSTKTILYRAPTAKTSAMTSSTPPW